VKMIEATYELQGGKYLVVDPCYVIRDAEYDRLCNEVGNNEVIVFSRDDVDVEVLVWHTRYGDGGYPVYLDGVRQGEAGVDSGLLALVPLDSVGSENKAGADSLGVTIEIMNCNARVAFGDMQLSWGGTEHVEVYTSDDDPYKSDEDDEDEEDEDEEDEEEDEESVDEDR
jgi:hypothetical protein